MRKEIRKQVCKLIPSDSRVIDIGCGNGSLLYMASPKIKYGLGVDVNKKKIKFANKRVKKEGLNNLEFKVMDSEELNLKKNFDIAIAMFAIHETNYETQIKTLKNMSKIAKEIILVDYVWPESIKNKILIYMEEHLAGHYKKFKSYKENGEMPRLIEKSGLKLDKELNGINDMYKIWICKN